MLALLLRKLLPLLSSATAPQTLSSVVLDGAAPARLASQMQITWLPLEGLVLTRFLCWRQCQAASHVDEIGERFAVTFLRLKASHHDREKLDRRG
jgi:hypothetical protein